MFLSLVSDPLTRTLVLFRKESFRHFFCLPPLRLPVVSCARSLMKLVMLVFKCMVVFFLVAAAIAPPTRNLYPLLTKNL